MSRRRYQTSRHPTSRNELEDVKVSPTFSKYTVQSILHVDMRNSHHRHNPRYPNPAPIIHPVLTYRPISEHLWDGRSTRARQGIAVWHHEQGPVLDEVAFG